jgi:hypothetical protein
MAFPDRLGLAVPLFQAPMAGVSTPVMTAAKNPVIPLPPYTSPLPAFPWI